MHASARALAIALGVAHAGCRHRAPPPDSLGDANEGGAPQAQVARSRITTRAAFALADAELAIEDVAMTSRFDAILARAGGSKAIAVNGGFFGVDGRADGLAVAHGKTLGAFVPTMSGGVLWVDGGVGHLTATEDYARDGARPDFAVQCRPRLVVGGRVNIKSDDGKRARRTALCLRDGGRTLEIDVAYDDAPTLFELATELAARGCEDALNLDGGPSTGFAIRREDGGVEAAPARGPVRHAIVVRAR